MTFRVTLLLLKFKRQHTLNFRNSHSVSVKHLSQIHLKRYWLIKLIITKFGKEIDFQGMFPTCFLFVILQKKGEKRLTAGKLTQLKQ